MLHRRNGLDRGGMRGYHTLMEYRLRYDAGSLKHGVKRILRSLFIGYAAGWSVVAAAAFGVAVWTQGVVAAVALAVGVTWVTVLLALRFFLIRREITESFLPQGGDELRLTTTESGLLAELPALGSRSFHPWKMLRILPLRAGDEALCLADAASGGVLLLPLHGLSAEERTALQATLAAAIEAAKQATASAAAPLPPPEGFGEPGVGHSPAGLAEGYDKVGWQKYGRRVVGGACGFVFLLLLLWVGYALSPRTAVFDRFSYAGGLCVLSLYALYKMGSRLRHPGRVLLRKSRRFVSESTYAWNADGTALLIRRPSGGWSVLPLSLAEKAHPGESCWVLELRKKIFLVLPRELPLPAALPVPSMRYRFPQWAAAFGVLVGLSAAVAGYRWYHDPAVEETQHAELMEAAWYQFTASCSHATEADADEAARHLREGADKWTRLETGWFPASRSRQRIFRARLAIFLHVWGEHFPEQWQEVRGTMPAEAQQALQEEQTRWANLLEEWAELQKQSERITAAAEEAQKAEEQHAAAADRDEADAALQGLMAEWVQYCRDVEAWLADTDETDYPEELMQRDAVLKTRLHIWEEAFPEAYQAARDALPEPDCRRLIDETEGGEEDE